MKKTSKWLSHLSIFLILCSFVTYPIQIIAQEVMDQVPISEQISKGPQQIENENYEKVDDLNIVTDLDQTDTSDSISETNTNDDDLLNVQEELLEDVSASEDEEENSDIVLYSSEGYSHVELSPGIVVVTTPSDATIVNLAEYLDKQFQRTDIQSLTVHGMINTGTNNNVSSSYGLARFPNLSYLEMVDLEIVGAVTLYYLFNLSEMYLPKVKEIGDAAFMANSSLLKFTAPKVETVGINSFAMVSNLEVLDTPNWDGLSSTSGFASWSGAGDNVREMSTGIFAADITVDLFPKVEKQTINFRTSVSQDENAMIFSQVEDLTINGLTQIHVNTFTGNAENVTTLSGESITQANLQGFTSLENIDFDDKLTSIWANSFSGTKIKSLNLSSLINNLSNNAFAGAEYLKEIYIPNLPVGNIPATLTLPNSLEILGTTSDRLSAFQDTLDANPSVLFAATESNDELPLEDKEVSIGATETLKTDLSSYILNEDLSQTKFELTHNWFFEGELIGTSDTYTITDMNQNNVGRYQFSVNLTPIGDATYSGTRQSRQAQVDIVENEINFESVFSINTVVGDLQELEIPFTSTVTNMISSFQITIPESLKVDDENIEIYMITAPSSLPLGATVTIVDRVINISNFPLIVGFEYYLNIPIMPIAVSEQTEEIKIEFIGNRDTLELSGEVLVSSGEFSVSIPDKIDFEEVSLDFSSIQSTIKKVNQLDIDITSFTAQEESWEIMVSATPFLDTDNQEVDEEVIRMVYKENVYMMNLSEEILLSSGSFSGNLDYDFRTGTWENHSYILTQLVEEGFHVLVGNNYYKLESKQTYTTELNFTIQYSP